MSNSINRELTERIRDSDTDVVLKPNRWHGRDIVFGGVAETRWNLNRRCYR